LERDKAVKNLLSIYFFLNFFTKMNTTIGLDIGTNSVGWAVISPENMENMILGLGTHIFPEGVTEKSKESRNKVRRDARLTRRNLFRFRLRRKSLLNFIQEKIQIPTDFPPQKVYQVYEWRNKAVQERIQVEQLAQIWLLLNARRGFKSSRKDKAKDEKEEKELGKVKGGVESTKKQLEKADVQTIGQLFWRLLYSRPLDFLDEIALLNTLKEGEQKKYFDSENNLGQNQALRRRYIGRKLLEDEFNLIWEKQKAFYPQLLTEENKAILHKIIFFVRPLKSQKGLVGKCEFTGKRRIQKSMIEFEEFRIWQILGNLRLTHFNKDSQQIEIRPLFLEEKKAIFEHCQQKSEGVKIDDIVKKFFKKGFVDATITGLGKKALPSMPTTYRLRAILGQEEFEKALESYHKSNYEEKNQHILFQMWHCANFFDNDEKLAQKAQKDFGFTEAQAKEYIKFNPVDGYGSLSLRATVHILAKMKEGFEYDKACLELGFHHSQKDTEKNTEKKIPTPQNHELRNPVVQRAVTETIRLVNDLLKKYPQTNQIKVELVRGLKKTAEERQNIDNKNNAIHERRLKIAQFLTKNSKKIFGYEKDFSLDIFSDKSMISKFELWAELELSDDVVFDRKLAEKFADVSKKIKDEDLDKFHFWLEANRMSVYTGKRIPLSQLFDENKYQIEHILPYKRFRDDSQSNKTISETWFNKDKDNSTPYECIFLRGKNKEKWDEFAARAKHFPKAKANKLLSNKSETDDFLAEQLTDTAYIAKEVRKYLERIKGVEVEVMGGAVTGLVRKAWHLDSLLYPEQRNEEGKTIGLQDDAQQRKNRGDHRHHALDALVVALTNPHKVHQIWAKFCKENPDADYKDFFRKKPNDTYYLPFPYESKQGSFRNEILQALKSILVSRRPEKNLIFRRQDRTIKKQNLERTKQGLPKLPQKYHIGIRGELHEQSNYGKLNPENAPKHIKANKNKDQDIFVIRKALSSLSDKDLGNIMDKTVRETISQHLKNGGRLTDKILMPLDRNGDRIPIRKVRVAVYKSPTSMIELYPNGGKDGSHSKNLFVPSGDNYCLAIYEDSNHNRDFEVVNFAKAVQRKLKKEPIIPAKAGKKLIYSLKKGDYFILYENTPDEIKVNWENLSLADKQCLSRRLFLVKSIGDDIYLTHHIIAKIVPTKERIKGLMAYFSPKKFKGIPVTVDRLGNIHKK